MRTLTFTALLSAALLCAGCGDTSSGPSPSKVFITQIQTSAGLASRTFASGPLNSDVLTAGSIVDDLAQVSFQLTLKDPGVPGNTNQPSVLNAVTFTRYHVDFRRADGRNTPGVDVPFSFDAAQTFTVQDKIDIIVELVRHVAKAEAPLAALAADRNIISTIATITFYGKDQAGNNVIVTGQVQVNFGNFADPT
ncbi:MAG: hypothetical protein DMF87_13715 [Acidobacteria bacterium]|nr:MAG: hypothetical protein DMF88_10110 [Acidobacteriota bacterium]PYR78608.1 MAG: hypothetical protein DMF87_13715 [Acidobacteriota bacterium]